MTGKRKAQIALLILTLAFIWGHSCMPVSASAAESGRALELLRPILELFVGEDNVTDHLVRKLAHFAEFGALGIQLFFLQRDRSWERATRSVGLAFLTAFFDESIQMLSGRGDQIIDVWLDGVRRSDRRRCGIFDRVDKSSAAHPRL